MKKAGRIIIIIFIVFAGAFAYLKTHPQKLNKLSNTSKKTEETTSKREKTTDWTQDRILSDGDVIEYKQYIFYERDDYKIIRKVILFV